jgi:DNA-binding response OmpR family regulator
MKVLVAEDDIHIRGGLVEILEAEGYETVIASDGAAALAVWRRVQPDFLLLDIMMPQQNGYDVCRAVRAEDPEVPIIFISAKSEEIDRVLGLELGADDFIVKPFGVKEVIARIRAVTRRALRRSARSGRNRPDRTPFTLGDLEVSPAELRARRGDEAAIDLSLRDVRILALLHARAGQVVDRETFFRECWGYDHIPNSRTLDQHISKLRKRVERDPRSPALICTVHGVGYRYDP